MVWQTDVRMACGGNFAFRTTLVWLRTTSICSHPAVDSLRRRSACSDCRPDAGGRRAVVSSVVESLVFSNPVGSQHMVMACSSPFVGMSSVRLIGLWLAFCADLWRPSCRNDCLRLFELVLRPHDQTAASMVAPKASLAVSTSLSSTCEQFYERVPADRLVCRLSLSPGHLRSVPAFVPGVCSP